MKVRARGASLWALLPAVALASTPIDVTGYSPVGKVVALLTEMKTQVEKEAKEDKQAYDKYACWCETTRAEKTQAVANAEKTIAELEAFLQEAAGLEAQLKTEIAGLEQSIAEDQDALATATALREKEEAAFSATQADIQETILALKGATDVLGKVQLLQQRHMGGETAAAQEVRPLLLQLKVAMQGIQSRTAGYRSVLQKDLWDVMSSLDEADDAAPAGGSFSAIEEHGRLRVRQPTGAAAGASSYSARSGSIFGLLSQMKDEFSSDLAEEQRKDFEALVSYQTLRALKLSEIYAADKSRKEKEATLADTLQKAAQAKEDLEATKDALAADQEFLVTLEKNCKANDDDYKARSKVRSEELVALSETLKILTQDDARDLFGRGVTFIQLRSTRRLSVGRGRAAAGAAADRARRRRVVVDGVVKKLLRVARKHQNLHLVLLAVQAKLDAFEKVKEVMDKMTAELNSQQKAEYEKKALCDKEIDKLEDDLKVEALEHRDLEAKKLGEENTIATLTQEIDALKAEVESLKVALKQASEHRKEENLLFQSSVADQRAIINLLGKAKDRLDQFYSGNTTLVQVSQVPGARVAPPPPKPQDYSKSGTAGGVLQILATIISTAAQEEAVLLAEEQNSQANYAELARATTAAIEADSTSISEKSALLAETESALSYTKADLAASEQETAQLTDTLHAVHIDCDYLLKYYDIRQQARAEELSAIADAKAVLSGADFKVA